MRILSDRIVFAFPTTINRCLYSIYFNVSFFKTPNTISPGTVQYPQVEGVDCHVIVHAISRDVIAKL